jgi:hypothetical protein
MQYYVQAKLVTGETIIGVLTEETSDHLEIACPMSIKYHSVLIPPGKVVEHLTASPYMRLSDDLCLIMDRSHVVATQSLNKQGISIYVNLLDEHHDEYELKHAGIYDFVEDRYKELAAEKRKIETLDDINTSLDIIKSLIDKGKEASEEEATSEQLSKGRIIH